jgi:3-isopropylmalate/(R)-2-methylmalate dehydratase large subunit
MNMPSTITEKIIAAHSDQGQVRPGQLVEVDVDLALANDITAPMAIEVFKSTGVEQVFDPDKIVLVPDHFVPNKDIRSAEMVQLVRNFAKEQGIDNFFDLDRMGVEHALLPEAGLVLPGDLAIGADSHTCTYGGLGALATGMGSTDLAGIYLTGRTWLKVPESMKFVYNGQLGPWVGGKDLILMTIGDIGVDGALYRAMEFCGPVIEQLSMDHRLTMCNMAIEAGAKNGIIPPDAVTEAYVASRAGRKYTFHRSDGDAQYAVVKTYDVTGLEPQVARPHLPENVVGVSQLKDVTVDQSVIGSCTNGRLEDMELAAKVLEGRRIKPGFRLIVIPATRQVYQKALQGGLLEIFLSAGAVISTPTCGPCLGGYMGILAPGERCIATTNRNFVGRMGHPKSEVYLSNPAVAAASAVAGRIVSPDDL